MQKHTMTFGIEDWWISDYSSLIYQEPATLFVEALEDSTMLNSKLGKLLGGYKPSRNL